MDYKVGDDGNVTNSIRIHAKGYSPVAQIDIDSSGSTEYLYFVQDHLGSPVVSVDNTGSVQTRNRYDALGQMTNPNGVANIPSTDQDIKKAEKNRGYTGHELMAKFNIGQWNARAYDYEIGAFLQADALIQGRSIAALNRYALGQNKNPNVTDPSGLASAWDNPRPLRFYEPTARRVEARARAAWENRAAITRQRELAQHPAVVRQGRLAAREAAQQAADATHSGLTHHQKYYSEDLLPTFGIELIEVPAMSDDFKTLNAELEFPDPREYRYSDLAAGNVGAIYIAKTENRGYGLFAGRKFKKGDLIGSYTGYISSTVSKNGAYSWLFLDTPGLNFSLDAALEGNALRFANDADPLNLIVENDAANNILYYASRDIEPGEELLVSYGPYYWKKQGRGVRN